MRSLITLAAVVLVAGPTSAATVSGTVQILGKGGTPYDDRAGVVVYIENVASAPRSKLPEATMAMERKEFAPRVIAIRSGTTVAFPNRDRILHNVFSLTDDNSFDLDLYRRPEVARHTFETAGVVRVFCNIHPQMSGIIVVRDDPYFALTESDGRFVIRDVPPGPHTVTAWFEQAEPVQATVVVPEAGLGGVVLTLDASDYKRVQHKNKFGKRYSRRRRY